LSTAANSDPLQARLANTNQFPRSQVLATTVFSKPTLLNDVFWDNRAGNFSGGYVYGIGGKLPDGTDNSVNNWDLGVVDVPGALLNPTHSVVQVPDGTTADATNSDADPNFAGSYDVTVNVLASRTYPAFRQAVIVAELLPPSLMGNYHLGATPASAARGLGAANVGVIWGTGTNPFVYTVSAPPLDIDGNPRPTVTGPVNNQVRRYDAGSDQMTP
jgi:hypothetical protein